MGVTVTPMLVVGVKSSTLVKSEITHEEFEVHDERGNPTGKFKTESTKTLYLINEPIKKIKDEGYLDSVTDLLGLVEYPKVGDFGFHNTDYETNDYLETGIVGICIASLSDVMYGSQIEAIDHSEIVKVTNQVMTIIKAMYGVDVIPQTFLFANVG